MRFGTTLGLAAVLVAAAPRGGISFSPAVDGGRMRTTTTSTATTTCTSRTCSSRRVPQPLFAGATLEAPPTDVEEAYGTVVGDTKGAELRLDGVAISRGSSPLLKNIDWSVNPGERWGIVGVNGAGKSTLLGAITGTVRMDEGRALVHRICRVGYLRQTAVSGSTRTVAEEARSEMTLVEEAREAWATTAVKRAMARTLIAWETPANYMRED